MVKDIIKNTHIISSKITKFIWFIGYCNFSKINIYFETDGVLHMSSLDFYLSFLNVN